MGGGVVKASIGAGVTAGVSSCCCFIYVGGGVVNASIGAGAGCFVFVHVGVGVANASMGGGGAEVGNLVSYDMMRRGSFISIIERSASARSSRGTPKYGSKSKVSASA